MMEGLLVFVMSMQNLSSVPTRFCRTFQVCGPNSGLRGCAKIIFPLLFIVSNAMQAWQRLLQHQTDPTEQQRASKIKGDVIVCRN